MSVPSRESSADLDKPVDGDGRTSVNRKSSELEDADDSNDSGESAESSLKVKSGLRPDGQKAKYGEPGHNPYSADSSPSPSTSKPTKKKMSSSSIDSDVPMTARSKTVKYTASSQQNKDWMRSRTKKHSIKSKPTEKRSPGGRRQPGKVEPVANPDDGEEAVPTAGAQTTVPERPKKKSSPRAQRESSGPYHPPDDTEPEPEPQPEPQPEQKKSTAKNSTRTKSKNITDPFDPRYKGTKRTKKKKTPPPPRKANPFKDKFWKVRKIPQQSSKPTQGKRTMAGSDDEDVSEEEPQPDDLRDDPEEQESEKEPPPVKRPTHGKAPQKILASTRARRDGVNYAGDGGGGRRRQARGPRQPCKKPCRRYKCRCSGITTARGEVKKHRCYRTFNRPPVVYCWPHRKQDPNWAGNTGGGNTGGHAGGGGGARGGGGRGGGGGGRGGK